MRRDVVWSPLAQEDLTSILDYLDKNWNAAVAVKLLDKIESVVSIIARHPERHQLINQEWGIRKCVITKHNTLFYRELLNKVEIVRLFDTRQHPEKLGFDKE